MSKFHDEFFRRGSPTHDRLMIKCLSKEGIDKIIKSIDFNDVINEQFNQNEQRVWICSYGEGRSARRDLENIKPNTGMTPVYGDPLEKYRRTGERRACDQEAICEYANTCRWLLEGKKVESAVVKRVYHAVPLKSEYETEVIVKNGHFILGYADAVISTTYNIIADAQIDPNWTWRKFNEFSTTGRIIVEVKPTVDSIGDVIRQIKTYYDALVNKYSQDSIVPFKCLVTYDHLDQESLDYLANENIKVVVFEDA